MSTSYIEVARVVREVLQDTIEWTEEPSPVHMEARPKACSAVARSKMANLRQTPDHAIHQAS